MGIFDKAKDLAGQAAGDHNEQIDQGIQQAGDFVDEKTGGKFGDQIDQGEGMAQDAVDQFANQDQNNENN